MNTQLKIKRVFPTANGNGFEAFNIYSFTECGALWRYLDERTLFERIDTLDGKKSAHLWDSKNWSNAGKFVELTINSWRADLCTIAAYKIASFGFKTYLSKTKTYGFYVNYLGLPIYFQSDLGGIVFSCNYRALDAHGGRKIGTGARISDNEYSLSELTSENLIGARLDSAPRWAVGNTPHKLLTESDMLKQLYSDYSLIEFSENIKTFNHESGAL